MFNEPKGKEERIPKKRACLNRELSFNAYNWEGKKRSKYHSTPKLEGKENMPTALLIFNFKDHRGGEEKGGETKKPEKKGHMKRHTELRGEKKGS